MAESFDRNTSYSITDDMIKEALKSGLSSIKASDDLINLTLEKCQKEITEEKQSKKTRSFINMAYKLGAPLAAGALVLVLILTIPGVNNSSKTSEAAPQAPMASAAFDSASANSISEAAPAAPATATINSDEITMTSGYREGNGSNKDKNAEDGGSLLGAEEPVQYSMRSDLEPQNANEFSVFLGDRFISLEDSGTDDQLVSVLKSILGDHDSESVRVLDDSADTFEGMTVKTLEYDGITVIISGTGTFSISSMEITDEKYSTFRGITVGMPVDDLKGKYESINQALDGRTDPDNCAYLIEDSDYFIRFEVIDGIITLIKYYTEIG